MASSNFAERLEQAISSLGLSQSESARRIAITPPALNKLISSKSNPSDQTLLLLELRLGISRSWLETGEGEMFAAPAPASDEGRAGNTQIQTISSALAKLDKIFGARDPADPADVLKAGIFPKANVAMNAATVIGPLGIEPLEIILRECGNELMRLYGVIDSLERALKESEDRENYEREEMMFYFRQIAKKTDIDLVDRDGKPVQWIKIKEVGTEGDQ